MLQIEYVNGLLVVCSRPLRPVERHVLLEVRRHPGRTRPQLVGPCRAWRHSAKAWDTAARDLIALGLVYECEDGRLYDGGGA